MPKIRVLAFGIAKDIVGTSLLELELDEGASVADMKAILLARFPEFYKLTSLRVAVNTDYASDEQQLCAQDEVVLIPPVSGG